MWLFLPKGVYYTYFIWLVVSNSRQIESRESERGGEGRERDKLPVAMQDKKEVFIQYSL